MCCNINLPPQGTIKRSFWTAAGRLSVSNKVRLNSLNNVYRYSACTDEIIYLNRNVMQTANFCKCNQCETILFDQNPQIGAIEYPVSKFPNAVEMQYMPGLIENTDTDLVWACPVCLNDANLIDI